MVRSFLNSVGIESNLTIDTGCKFNVHKTFRTRPRRLVNVLCTFNLRLLSRGQWHKLSLHCLLQIIVKFLKVTLWNLACSRNYRLISHSYMHHMARFKNKTSGNILEYLPIFWSDRGTYQIYTANEIYELPRYFEVVFLWRNLTKVLGFNFYFQFKVEFLEQVMAASKNQHCYCISSIFS